MNKGQTVFAYLCGGIMCSFLYTGHLMGKSGALNTPAGDKTFMLIGGMFCLSTALFGISGYFNKSDIRPWMASLVTFTGVAGLAYIVYQFTIIV